MVKIIKEMTTVIPFKVVYNYLFDSFNYKLMPGIAQKIDHSK